MQQLNNDDAVMVESRPKFKASLRQIYERVGEDALAKNRPVTLVVGLAGFARHDGPLGDSLHVSSSRHIHGLSPWRFRNLRASIIAGSESNKISYTSHSCS